MCPWQSQLCKRGNVTCVAISGSRFQAGILFGCPSKQCRSRNWDTPVPANPDKYKVPKHRLTGHAACDPEYVPLKPVEQAIVDSLPRTEHDVKACRLYGCLMCKMAKA